MSARPAQFKQFAHRRGPRILHALAHLSVAARIPALGWSRCPSRHHCVTPALKVLATTSRW